MFTKYWLTPYALVICNQGPPPPGNSGDFDFFPSKSLLEAPPCRDKQMVKSRLNDPTLRGSSGLSSPGFRFRYIPFPLVLVCLSEVTILTFSYFSYGADSPIDTGSNLAHKHF